MRKISLILTAAGRGARFESELPKQFLEVGGRPILVHALESLSPLSRFHQVVITIDPQDQLRAEQMLEATFPNTHIVWVHGGPTRQESVHLGFSQLQPVKYVFIHDGARACVSKKLIERLLDETRKEPSVEAIVPGIPVTDTIKQVRDRKVVQSLQREHLIAVQTPQVFRWDVLNKAYQTCSGLADSSFTDEAMLVERAGFPVQVIQGEPGNIKLTYPHDKLLLEHILSTTHNTG